ncbi:uncharacterized protein LOC121967910 isoform X1 [Zingiber officinale]|uniref:uncharacterized protein LOC121967910 isoform X1 n=1 Tax=Zingiber officinale TaxID=94328 RepID=UPI001C4C82E2|nr:uncharacterized protein LOC121967910 isoform X1 [Zingiber officinale]XP_042374366.1 uncharacterized protein LOC121967910 isoform X1 [Zingiber officinale]XP_042374367.1 uncharacterized protein LOC121967910 isoform X1 [Zingiber officinale]
METPRIRSRFSACSTRERHCRGVSGVREDVFNLSPQPSYRNPATHFERKLDYTKSFSFQEAAPSRSSIASIGSYDTSVSKSASELVREISALELEVIQLERHLLSLYRAAFDQYLFGSPTSSYNACNSVTHSNSRSIEQETELWKGYETNDVAKLDVLFDKECRTKSLENEEGRYNFGRGEQSHDTASDICSRRSLADHLGTSVTHRVPEICCRLSEEILRCIAAIYCKLASRPPHNIDLLDSPTPSVSSTSTLSTRDPGDGWSPGFRCETTERNSRPGSYKDKKNPYSDMIEIPQVRIDGERFKYASHKLNIFRSLIRRLETIDPRKMTHEEQLAFWINIHNALVMHALLAYGLRENNIKGTCAILKAAYNIGGHSVNAFIIQSSILGCQLHRPALYSSKIFSVKLPSVKDKHPYSLDRSEPLVHFALCSGSSSDPVLRAYTAKGIRQDLEIAKAEFIQANVCVVKETKIMLPKILQYYAKDSCMELLDLLEMICDHFSSPEGKAIRACCKRKPEKFVEWSPFKSSFGYIVHKDLAK